MHRARISHTGRYCVAPRVVPAARPLAPLLFSGTSSNSLTTKDNSFTLLRSSEFSGSNMLDARETPGSLLRFSYVATPRGASMRAMMVPIPPFGPQLQSAISADTRPVCYPPPSVLLHPRTPLTYHLSCVIQWWIRAKQN